MEAKNAKEHNDRCGSETDRISLREKISWVIQTRPILRRRGWPWVHFLANAKQLSALDLANLYKKRWLIELFFKWLKQHLKIKKFWGTTENAVRIQISVAIITYCLVAIVQHDMKLKRSTYEVLQILSISLTDKTHLRDLFDKTNFNDVKDLNDPLIPGLFD